MKVKVFGIISLIFGAIVGFVVMNYEPRASVFAAIVAIAVVFWLLCIFTNTSEAEL